jgi:hypothetical protein
LRKIHEPYFDKLTIERDDQSCSFFKSYKSAVMFGLNKDNAQGQVTELIDRLKSQAGLNDEQAAKVIETIKDFVVDKYPMLSGAVNNIFGSK